MTSNRQNSSTTIQASSTQNSTPNQSDDSDNEYNLENTQIPARQLTNIPGLDKIQKCLLNFCLSLLDHQTETDELECPLVIALAVLGVKETGFHGPESYPSMLSSIIKISRFLVCRYSYEESTTLRPQSNDELGSESEDISLIDLGLELGSGPLTRLTTLVNQFMISGSHSPMDWLLSLRAYGIKIAQNTTSPGQIDWNGDTIAYRNISFSLLDFRGFIHGLISSTRSILINDILFESYFTHSTSQIPEIPWGDIHDNPLDPTPFSDFLSNSRSNFQLSNSARWLWDRIMSNPILYRRFRKSNSQGDWKHKRLERFFSIIHQFLEKLSILFDITGGGPPRGTELLSIRCSNSVNSGHRNIYYENGLLCYVTFYHKGYSISGSTKIIHRYLPREIGELLVYYQWLVRPFQQRIAQSIFHKPMSDYLFEKSTRSSKHTRPMTSSDFRLIFRRETTLGLGIAINPSEYRHIAIGIARRFLQKTSGFESSNDSLNSDSEDDSDYEDDVIDLQASHKTRTSLLIYARGLLEKPGETSTLKARFRQASIVS